MEIKGNKRWFKMLGDKYIFDVRKAKLFVIDGKHKANFKLEENKFILQNTTYSTKYTQELLRRANTNIESVLRKE